jgi:hypothetical protein
MNDYRLIFPSSPQQLVYLPILFKRYKGRRQCQELIAFIPALSVPLTSDQLDEPIVGFQEPALAKITVTSMAR